MHVSDCSIWEDGKCDCGDLDFASYPAHRFVTACIPSAGCFGLFVNHMGRECFIEPEQLPTDTLIAIAAASDLPNAGYCIALSSVSDSVNLNNSREVVISNFKAFLRSDCIAPN
ncbi:hypothetical protein [Brucella sp. NBRC 12950]|uniref:hypothetical protein n=1 Tax=Brucella sp. NBRC 12950 TaxID=2994518 RepID=UPI0024A5A75D|nr:hypothetical protein [Brucella sp. NBRC 12950]GLU25543.1 hypothetical protein Brsp01_07760 [Brucella sp. NBRC 12950]